VKKTISILLFICFAMMLPLKPLALSLYQQIWKLHIYSQLKNEIKSEHLSQLTFSKNDINSRRIDFKFIKENEFSFNGMMFDIKSTNETKDSISFTCYRDIKEMLLISAIHNAITHSGNFEQPLPNKLLKLFNTLNFDNFELINNALISLSEYISPNFSPSKKFNDIILLINTPPPELFS
jgi:hypothetical protein